MKIYYSRVNGTNDGVNGSALQMLIDNLQMQGKVEISRWTNDKVVYSFEKLDKADIMIVGYKEDNHDIDDSTFMIGKGVYDEIKRAYSKKIPVFWLNLAEEEQPYLERIVFDDIEIYDSLNFKEFARISIDDSYGYKIQMKINSKREELVLYFKDNGYTVKESTSLSTDIATSSSITTNAEIVESNKLLLLLLR